MSSFLRRITSSRYFCLGISGISICVFILILSTIHHFTRTACKDDLARNPSNEYLSRQAQKLRRMLAAAKLTLTTTLVVLLSGGTLYIPQASSQSVDSKTSHYSGSSGSGAGVSLANNKGVEGTCDAKTQNCEGQPRSIYHEDPAINELEKPENSTEAQLPLQGPTLRDGRWRLADKSPHYKGELLLLYSELELKGEVETCEEDRPVLDLDNRVRTLSVSGPKKWSIYSEPNYKGSIVCVSPPSPSPDTPGIFRNLVGVGLTPDKIRSVRVGCHIKTDN